MFTKNLNFIYYLRIFRTVFLFITFLSSFHSYAQQSENQNQIEPATVVLSNGAKIYSTDEAFNQQINSQAIILKNADRISENQNSDKVLLANNSKTETLQKDFKQEVRNLNERKQKEEFRKVKKEIDQHEERKKAFKINNFRGVPSSDAFISSTHSNKDSVISGCNYNELSKVFISLSFYPVKSALDFLYIQKYASYNTISFDYCFSWVYSVRPPPVLI